MCSQLLGRTAGLPDLWGWIFGEQRKKQLDWLFKAWTEVFLQRPAAVQRLVSQANLHKFTAKEGGKEQSFHTENLGSRDSKAR